TGSKDRTVRLWDLATGKELAHLLGHSGAVTHLAFSSDGKHLVSASSDPTDRVVSWWDLATGMAQPPEERQFRGHGQGVQALSLSADGKTVLALDKVGMLHIWETETAKESRFMPTPRPAPASTLSPDGTLLIYLGGSQRQIQGRSLDKD